MTTERAGAGGAYEVLDLGADLPTRIRFGAGSRREVGRVAAAAGPRTVLVVGSSFAANPGAADVLEALDAAGVMIAAQQVSRGEPDDAAVLALVRILDEVRADSVVAVGGGSVLDLAKAAGQRPDAERLDALLAGERTETPGLPVVALPTTAGSGAEVSHAAIVTHRASGRKRGIRGPGVAARDAMVDPELMRGAPATVVAAAGFDALAHAVETSASRAATEPVIERGGAALRSLLDAVPRAVRAAVPRATLEDADAMGAAAYAALLMGVNLATSTTCLPHRLQYPVGARTGTGHAQGVAALMPAWLARTREAAPDSLARLAVAAGLAPASATSDEAARALSDRVIAHLEETGMTTRLVDLGIARADVDELVAAVEGSVANDPGPSGPDDLRELYLASL